jgi:hypothetical protein
MFLAVLTRGQPDQMAVPMDLTAASFIATRAFTSGRAVPVGIAARCGADQGGPMTISELVHGIGFAVLAEKMAENVSH